MRRIWPLVLALLPACDDPAWPGPSARRTDPPEQITAGCGDELCAVDETPYACARDCLPEGLRVEARALSECAGSRTREELGRDVDVSMRFAEALVGLVDLLDAYDEFASTARGVLRYLADDPRKTLTPEHVSHDPTTGAYRRYDGRGGTALFTLRFGADYEVGKRGDVIAPHFFVADSYLVGAVVRVGKTSAVVDSYERTGPLVELLGLGPTPPSSFTLDESEAYQETEKQQLDASFEWESTKRGTRAAWRATSRRPLRATPGLVIEVRDVSVTEPRGATVDVTGLSVTGEAKNGFFSGIYTAWDVAVEWRVASGAFPHRGSFRLVSLSGAPMLVTLECP